LQAGVLELDLARQPFAEAELRDLERPAVLLFAASVACPFAKSFAAVRASSAAAFSAWRRRAFASSRLARATSSPPRRRPPVRMGIETASVTLQSGRKSPSDGSPEEG
jgi:hypothetical protein